MFIKLGIIIGVVILGGVVFSNEIDNLFPNTSATVFDSLKNDTSNFSSKALDSVEQRIDDSIDKIIDNTNDSISNKISDVGDEVASKISETKESSQEMINDVGDEVASKISETKESSQEMINDGILNFNLIEYVQSIYK